MRKAKFVGLSALILLVLTTYLILKNYEDKLDANEKARTQILTHAVVPLQESVSAEGTIANQAPPVSLEPTNPSSIAELPKMLSEAETAGEAIETPIKEPRAEGIIVNRAGAPVAGAYIFLGRVPQPQSTSIYSHEMVLQLFAREAATRSQDDGTFRLASVESESSIISAYHPDEGLGSVRVEFPRPMTDVRIVLVPGGGVEGRVTLGGVPVKNAWIAVRQSTYGGVIEEAFTDEEGRYRIEPIAAGLVAVEASLPRQDGVWGREVLGRTLRHSAEIVEGRVSNHAFNFSLTNIVVEGVVSIHGEPVQKGRVNLLMTGPDAEETREAMLDPDSNGTFYFENLPAGATTISVIAYGKDAITRQESVQLDLSDGDLIRRNFDFAGSSLLSGSVLGVTWPEQCAIVVHKGEIEISNIASGGWSELMIDAERRVIMRDSATYQFDDLDAGTYTVHAFTLEGPTLMRLASSIVELRDNEETVVDFDFR